MVRGRRKLREGLVVSDKMDKTVVVAIEQPKPHPLYKKIVRSVKRFKVHDELGSKVGDRVRIIETRPISKEKHWRVAAILEKTK